MTTAPFVELRFNPTDLRPGDLPRFGEYLGSPADAIEAALAVTRTAVIRQMKSDMRGLAEPTHSQVLRIADLAWQAAFWRFRKVSAPIMADAYMRAYLKAEAGDVPLAVIYELADKHAEKIGEYFHQTSRQGLSEGFNTLVNRRLPAKAVVDMVLDAYGLSPRQMRAFTSANQFNTPVSDVLPRSVKARARAYIDKAFTTRIHRLSQQEEHNIDEQAKQYAWMWLQDKGRLSEKAQKLWITARDERVCPVCGPLHGQRVLINERFVTKEGEFWSPGLHPNCRCVIRLLEHRFSKAATTLDWNPKLHPRGGDSRNPGRFSVNARTPDIDRRFSSIVDAETEAAKTKAEFDALVAAQPLSYGLRSPFVYQHTPVADLIGFTNGKVDARTVAFQTVKRDISSRVAKPEQKVQFVTKTRAALDMRAAADTKLVRAEPGTIPLGQKTYAMVTKEQFHELVSTGAVDTSRLEATELETYSNPQRVVDQAAAEIQGNVDRAINRVMKQEGASIRFRGHKADLTPEYVEGLVRWNALMGNRNPVDADTPTSAELTDGLDQEVFPEDAHGPPLGRHHITYSLASEYFAIRHQDFSVYVVEIDKGHDGKRPWLGKTKTEHVEGSHDPDDQTYELTGTFEQVGPPELVPGVTYDDEGKEIIWNVNVIKFQPNFDVDE